MEEIIEVYIAKYYVESLPLIMKGIFFFLEIICYTLFLTTAELVSFAAVIGVEDLVC